MDTMNVNKAFKDMILLFCLCMPILQIQCLQSNSFHSNNVFEIDALEYEADYKHKSSLRLVRAKRDVGSSSVTETESEKNDPKCEAQKESFSDLTARLKKGERLEEMHLFDNETKFNLALAWAGENDDGTLLVLTSTSHVQLLSSAESTLWRSTDHGRHWDDWSSHVNHEKFRKDDGLQRNPHSAKRVYLISYAHFIYFTEDGGYSWTKREMTDDPEEKTSMTVDEVLEFHGDSPYKDYVAVVDNKRRLLVTYDNFQTKPEVIKSKVHSVKWGTQKASTEDYIYAVTGDRGSEPPLLTLERYSKKTKKWMEILHKVVNFNVEGKFMYASIYKSDKPKSEEDNRLMMISTDGGESWKEAQLPTLTGDRFFSVLDMSEELIFMHVDNPGDTGHGTLYTSSSRGIVYSESLRNHLFPNYNTVHDFYKVKSIRGVYLASQMGADKSIHTVITYTQGAEWKNVSRPIDVDCENDISLGCNLQIHNAYSIHRGITARLPHSIENAPGLVLVHGHVASNIQTTPPDVFLSTDGGYNFRKVLSGPHAYEIADSGGILVAVPLSDETPDIVKFSTDEGHCWHTYRFTDKDIKFTGLLTEPGGKSMTVSIWGYTMDTKKWTVHIIDFNKVIPRKCKSEDYMEWIPHISLNKHSDLVGCLLGQREVFKKIKPDSWCQNGYFTAIEKKGSICPCTKEDYECDFGFFRKAGEEKCQRQFDVPVKDIEICNGKQLEEIISAGYRKLPGDVCDHEKGYRPEVERKIEDLDGLCKGPGDKSPITHDTKPLPVKTGSTKLVIIAVVSLVLIVVVGVGAFFLYKIVILRRHKTVYRYSMLNQGEEGENEFENALVSHDTLYHDTSDEEVEQENRSPKRQNGKPGSKSEPGLASYHDDSDDDMLG